MNDDIKLKLNSVAHVEPCRRVPFKLREPLQKELKHMEENQIIEKVHELTEWVNTLVLITKKDGSSYMFRSALSQLSDTERISRLCLKMTGAKVFSTLDADKAF